MNNFPDGCNEELVHLHFDGHGNDEPEEFFAVCPVCGFEGHFREGEDRRCLDCGTTMEWAEEEK